MFMNKLIPVATHALTVLITVFLLINYQDALFAQNESQDSVSEGQTDTAGFAGNNITRNNNEGDKQRVDSTEGGGAKGELLQIEPTYEQLNYDENRVYFDNLTLFLILIVLISVNYLFWYYFMKVRLKNLGATEKQLQELIKRNETLCAENEALRKKNEELSAKNDQNIEGNEVLAQGEKNDVDDAQQLLTPPLFNQQHKTNIFYARKLDLGNGFSQSSLKSTSEVAYYKVSVISESKAHFEIHPDKDKQLTAAEHSYVILESACTLENSPHEARHGIETVEKGELIKSGDDWIIQKKAVIRFI
jgi:regulator of replication initiation timing